MRKHPSFWKGVWVWRHGGLESERFGLYRKFFKLIQFCQHLRIVGDFPLLSADIGKLHDALLVDDEQPRALTEGDEFALYIVLAIDLKGVVYQGGERDRVFLEEALGVHHRIGGDHDDLGVSFLEEVIVLAQLLQMPAAEWSEKCT